MTIGRDRIYHDLPTGPTGHNPIEALTLKAFPARSCIADGYQCVNAVIMTLDVGFHDTVLMASKCRGCGGVTVWFNVDDPSYPIGGDTP